MAEIVDGETEKVEEKDASAEEQPETPRTWPQRIGSWTWQLAVVFAIYIGMTSFMTRSLLAVGKPAPAWTLVDMKGKQHSLQQYKGRRVVLYFWATWCGVCKANIPMLKVLASSYKNNPVLLSVVQDGHNVREIRKILKAKGINYPILRGTGSMVKSYKVSQFPTTYFIDKKGRISSKDTGYITPIGFWWRGLVSTVKGWWSD
ncbi:MAG: TlpA family protein disulfide reductase [Deltaproteobacteria bacterium]|nr:MAG: TlpA family protein disulfide reductase [Deltaproteobacteria bacterium]